MRLRRVRRVPKRCYCCGSRAKVERVGMDCIYSLCRLCDGALEAGGIYKLAVSEQTVFIELFRSGMTERRVYDGEAR